MNLSSSLKFELSSWAKLYPTVSDALNELASIRANLTLPKTTIHVISDIHGEFNKLKHVINNASGSLRLLVEEVFADRLSVPEKTLLLNLIYYPRESFLFLEPTFKDLRQRKGFVSTLIFRQFELLRKLAQENPLKRLEEIFPKSYLGMFRELLLAPYFKRSDDYLSALINVFISEKREIELLRLVARAVRNLLISEIVVAGDLGDRGPRIDRVIDYLMHQPNVTLTWGNHDASWMGACLGHLACIATVLRISLRYQRLGQLEEGYGITLTPLENLANSVYQDDPAQFFHCKGKDLRDPLKMARMQKAIAIIQLKLEGQVVSRNPQFQLDQRNLLHQINLQEGTVNLNGQTYPMRDLNFPTIDWKNPYALSQEEEVCITRLQQSFLESSVLWQQMNWVLKKGAMFLIRDQHLIFHACVPVDPSGDFLAFELDGAEYRGKALFEALAQVIPRAFRFAEEKDLDLLWYLWSGPLSPWFGKDKMTTFETYFVEDEASHKETKNPYFSLLHEEAFCRKILKEFGVNADSGLIVNGHVPVKIEQGENPIKRSNKAVTIDGAFSEAYGDKGFTLVLDSQGTYLAQHHHFDSIQEVITQGMDILPEIKKIFEFKRPRTVAETEQGEELNNQAQILEELISAYSLHLIQEV